MRSGTPSLFRDPASPAPASITAHCDGGARGNPGPAGFGVEITDASGHVLAELSDFLGIRTNNYAEYAGLLASLQYALDHGHTSLRVISDSELMVKQIQGRYKVNSPDLKPLWQEAKARIARLDHFEITHALRHKNKAADRLANQAMDRGMGRDASPEARPGNVTLSPTPKSTRAVPHPNSSSTAPPRPKSSEPAPRRSPDASASEAGGPPPSFAPTPLPGSSAPAMLRGFARDGVIHLLGSHTLPNGTFVKIIPE